MNAGDTYRHAHSRPGYDAKRHLWIVLSDPNLYPDEILVVFMTSLRSGMDQTCILEVGDHPFVTHKTTVAFGAAEVWAREELQDLLDSGDILPGEPIDAGLLTRIRFLALASPRFEPGHGRIGRKQGFR